ncbi:MAG: DUF1801 domain-containing protein [Woeseiaceae bacterium]
MKKSTRANSPDEYVGLLEGWSGECVKHLRKNVTSAADLEETIKWGHLVYFSNGPVLLIRAEDERVLFGFWRGKRLRDIEAGLKPGGKYEMATLEIRSKPYPSPATISKLVKEAVKLNKSLGNPQGDARKK